MTRYRIVPAFAFMLGMSGWIGCSSPAAEHSWLTFPDGSGHEIVESGGVGDGQVVIAMDPSITPDEALRLGEEILAQAPIGRTINVRLYNDPATARRWDRVPAEWTREHLWVLVRANPGSGLREVRWVGPEQE